MDLQSFLDEFNDGNLDVELYFNDYPTFFKLLKKKGLFGKLDPINATDSGNWQNEYLLWLYENDRKTFHYWVRNMLSDIEIIDNKVYLVDIRPDSLSTLFCQNRGNYLSQDRISSILSGEDSFDYFSYRVENTYTEVIEELTDQNIKVLKDRIVHELKDVQVTPYTELLEIIAQEQNHPDYVYVDSSNIDRIFDDEESMNEILNDELLEISSELDSIYSNAYNSAYESEIWKDVWEELQTYFVGRGEYTTVPHSFKPNTQIEKFRIEIRDFDNIIVNFLRENKSYGISGTLENYGYFLSLLSDPSVNECLSVYPRDYPSFGEIRENINNYFNDYF